MKVIHSDGVSGALTLLVGGALLCALCLENEANAQAYGSIRIGTDQYVSWDGPLDSSVWVQTDGGVPTFFARGSAGTQAAPWMMPGHVYTFILKDADGNEVARYTKDLRGS